MKPTMEPRIIPELSYQHEHVIRVLQQKFIDDSGHEQWIDVPFDPDAVRAVQRSMVE